MTPSLLEDRQDIEDVLVAYTHALDSRDWARLADCFTPDATTYYGELGGQNDDRDEIVATCRQALEPIGVSQHLVANIAIEVDGDAATAVCYLNGLHATKDTPGGDVCVVYGTYRDKIVRTDDGWKISHREIDIGWVEGNLAVMSGAVAATNGES
jgi:3-phenylpropionate/cinnamic acid dioxygenase small subunit